MAARLPLLSAQLSFGLEAQRGGRRPSVTSLLRIAPGRLSTANLRSVLQSVMYRNPALCYRVQFSRGEGYQEWSSVALDFVEHHAVTWEAASGCVAEAIEEFEAALGGPSMAARLIRSTEMDQLLLIYDHALVDEQSMSIVKQQLDTPSRPVGHQVSRYQAAILDRKASEDGAANGPGARFWADRLGKKGVGQPPLSPRASRVIPVVSVGGVAVPRSVRRSLFPYVLYSVHRVLQDVGTPGPSIIGYPWGGVRNPEYSDVAGCFMNTVLSHEARASRYTPHAFDDFFERWCTEIDHADVPVAAASTSGLSFTGAVTAQLSYTHATKRPVWVAGVPAVDAGSSHGRTPYMSSLVAGVVVSDDALELRLLLDEETAGFDNRKFIACWTHWLKTVLADASRRATDQTDTPALGETKRDHSCV